MSKKTSIQIYRDGQSKNLSFDGGIIHPSVKVGDYFKKGKNVIIDEDVIIGKNVFIGHSSVIRSGVVIGDNCVIGHLVVVERETTIGEGTTIQSQCHVTAYATVGRNCYFGPCVTLINEWKISSHGRPLKQTLLGPTIGDGCRIGARSLIMPGVVIGKNAMVGAGAIITKEIGENEVWFGKQAKRQGIVPVEERL